jgi:4-hydroxy-2-oxoheptanedioate aldolase
MLSLVGYPLLLIDLEHAPGDASLLPDLLRAAEIGGSSVMVRVPRGDTDLMTRLLDMGPAGVMIPMVSSAADAEAAVAACRYPPRGHRGWAASSGRASRYGLDTDYTHGTAPELVVTVQIETVAAVDAIDDICAVPGVDVVFIGANDLAADSGHILELDHPAVRELSDRTFIRAKAAGKKVGTITTRERSFASLIKDGFDVVMPVSDLSMLRETAIRELAEFRAVLG